ncbi:MAG TPA: NUDIX hydrolase [Candidatus Paceibacterota bacterium]
MTDTEPLYIDQGPDAPRPDLPFIERDAVVALVRDPQARKYLGLKWKEVDWETFVTGGIEEGQTAEEAARAEILEETGYKNLRLVADLPRYHTKFYHPPKGVNRFAHFQCFLFELENDDRNPVNEEEAGKHEAIWLTEEDLASFRLTEAQQVLLTHAKGIAWGGE